MSNITSSFVSFSYWNCGYGFCLFIFLLPFLTNIVLFLFGKSFFPSCAIFSVLFMCYIFKYFSPSYSINFRCWTGNVAATKMKWLFWWAGPSQVCTYSPHHCKCFFTNFKRDCINLHHNYILQAFVLKMVICTSYFFINNFPSFLKAKIAFKIELLLRLCSLGFGLNTLCCPLPLQHSVHHPAWCWDSKALPKHNNILLQGF